MEIIRFVGSFSQHMNHRYKYCRPYQAEMNNKLNEASNQESVIDWSINIKNSMVPYSEYFRVGDIRSIHEHHQWNDFFSLSIKPLLLSE